MPSVRILEDPVSAKPPGFNHVFSFGDNPADSFTEDYLTPGEASVIYDQAFAEAAVRLSSLPAGGGFDYRGVDILTCFRKPLFEHLYYVRTRYEIFRRIAARFPDSELHIDGPSSDSHYLNLSQIIPVFEKGPARLRQVPVPASAGPARPVAFRTRADFLKKAWPAHVERWTAAAQTAIYSDPAKTEAVLKVLSPSRCVYYADRAAPRLVLRAFRAGFGIFQSDFSRVDGELYLQKARGFARKTVSGEKGDETLFWARARSLFASSLAPLMYQIDRMHDFFRRTKLRSALLDEDISPVKNAFAQVARLYNVRSFVECHGALGHKSGFLPLTADAIFVWGEAQRRKMIVWGCPPDRVIAAGCSKYDPHCALDAGRAKRLISARFRLDAGKPISLVAFPSHLPSRRRLFEHLYVSVFREAFDVVESLPQVQFIIKFKSGTGDQNIDWARRRLAGNPLAGRVKLAEHDDPMLLARGADFLVTYGTTMGVDGFAMDKPVISLYDRTHGAFEEFRDFGVLLYANSGQELMDAVRKVLAGWRGARWNEARVQCLNEGVADSFNMIASFLTGEAHQAVHV